mmetsp:Transcript_31649/g.62623  ORF Transcript_31649/g.62623 Transcript_31649/m.62623 type:complete len:90 (-) Transcript_31649:916-1185(-)
MMTSDRQAHGQTDRSIVHECACRDQIKHAIPSSAHGKSMKPSKLAVGGRACRHEELATLDRWMDASEEEGAFSVSLSVAPSQSLPFQNI